MTTDTVEDTPTLRPADAGAVPGVVVVFAEGRACIDATPLVRNKIVVGREVAHGVQLRDDKASRRHAEIARRDDGWRVRDLGSRNGTRLDGSAVEREATGRDRSLLRVGRSLLLLCDDVRGFEGLDRESIGAGGFVVGPRLRATLEQVAAVARAGQPLVVTGESGSGKELAARAYHAATGRDGPFVAANCAAIPAGLAERIVFGARKGAFSGATSDAVGLVESADGGTLFLDEIGELEPSVQGKLLRVIETREVTRLGATRSREVDVRIVAATHKDLRAEVAAHRFREDLYYRLGQPPIRIPPLRERREEIPHLVEAALRDDATPLAAHADVVEACCLRPWPGNVRALLAELRRASLNARASGDDTVRMVHLDANAGCEIVVPPTTAKRPAELGREEVQAALAEAGGNVAAAARALGLHRTQLYRLLERLGLRAE